MSEERLQDILAAALVHHQAGELEEAERLYAKALAANPDDPDALHLLGLVKLQAGQPPLALELIGQAVTLRPLSTLFRLNQAAAFEMVGELRQAADCCRAVLAIDPTVAGVHLKLGVLLERLGTLNEALFAFEAAARLDDSSAEAHARL